MELGGIEVLLLITLLDSLSTGIVIPLLAPQILELGGLQITLGLLTSGIFISNSFSRDFLYNFEHGKKLGIIISLSFSLFVYLILIATSSYYLVLLCGWFHALSNRVCEYTKEYVALVKNDQKTKIFALFDFMGIIGIVIGPICAGYIFAWRNNVKYNALVSACLTYFALILLQLVDNDSPDPNKVPEKPATMSKAITQFKSLLEVNYLEYWDSVILRICYVSSFIIFFTQFAVLIDHNYCLDTVSIGYTVAYQNLILVLCNCFAPFIKKAVLKEADHAQNIFEYTLLLCSVNLVWIYYAPSYKTYLISVVPLFVCHAIIDNVWHSLNVEVDEEEFDANNALTHTAAITVPVFFGHMVDKKGPGAFKFFAVLPPVVCIYYLKQNFFNSNVSFIVRKISEKAMALKHEAEERAKLKEEEKKKKEEKELKKKKKRKKVEEESEEEEEEEMEKKKKKKKRRKKAKDESDEEEEEDEDEDKRRKKKKDKKKKRKRKDDSDDEEEEEGEEKSKKKKKEREDVEAGEDISGDEDRKETRDSLDKYEKKKKKRRGSRDEEAEAEEGEEDAEEAEDSDKESEKKRKKSKGSLDEEAESEEGEGEDSDEKLEKKKKKRKRSLDEKAEAEEDEEDAEEAEDSAKKLEKKKKKRKGSLDEEVKEDGAQEAEESEEKIEEKQQKRKETLTEGDDEKEGSEKSAEEDEESKEKNSGQESKESGQEADKTSEAKGSVKEDEEDKEVSDEAKTTEGETEKAPVADEEVKEAEEKAEDASEVAEAEKSADEAEEAKEVQPEAEKPADVEKEEAETEAAAEEGAPEEAPKEEEGAPEEAPKEEEGAPEEAPKEEEGAPEEAPKEEEQKPEEEPQG